MVNWCPTESWMLNAESWGRKPKLHTSPAPKDLLCCPPPPAAHPPSLRCPKSSVHWPMSSVAGQRRQQWGGCRIGFNLIKCFDAWQHCGAALDIRSIRHPTHLLLIRIRIRLKIPIRSRLPESLKAAFWGQLMASDPLLLLRKQFALKGFRFAQLTVGKAFVRIRPFGRQTAIYPDPKTPDHIRQPTSHIDMPKTTGLCLLTNHSWH